MQSSDSKGNQYNHMYSIDDITKVSRMIIIDAIKQYCHKDKNRSSIRRWLNSDRFSFICHASGWEDVWVKKLFNGLDSLDIQAKRRIFNQIKNMSTNG